MPTTLPDTTCWTCYHGHEKCPEHRPLVDYRGHIIPGTEIGRGASRSLTLPQLVQLVAEHNERRHVDMIREAERERRVTERRQSLLESLELMPGTAFGHRDGAMRLAGIGGIIQHHSGAEMMVTESGMLQAISTDGTVGSAENRTARVVDGWRVSARSNRPLSDEIFAGDQPERTTTLDEAMRAAGMDGIIRRRDRFYKVIDVFTLVRCHEDGTGFGPGPVHIRDLSRGGWSVARADITEQYYMSFEDAARVVGPGGLIRGEGHLENFRVLSTDPVEVQSTVREYLTNLRAGSFFPALRWAIIEFGSATAPIDDDDEDDEAETGLRFMGGSDDGWHALGTVSGESPVFARFMTEESSAWTTVVRPTDNYVIPEVFSEARANTVANTLRDMIVTDETRPSVVSNDVGRLSELIHHMYEEISESGVDLDGFTAPDQD